jgi:hypothetical protein
MILEWFNREQICHLPISTSLNIENFLDQIAQLMEQK